MHKKLKLFVSMLAAAAMLVLLPGSNVMTARADEAKTYSIKYIGGNVNGWRYVSGNTFEDGMSHRELYYLINQDLKDGDQIVIYAGDTAANMELDLSAFKLSNLTIHRDATAVVFTAGVRDCYVLAGAVAAINGDVTNAHLYDNTTCTFNNNVLDMVLHIDNEPHSNISCLGTVGMFQVLRNSGSSWCTFYDLPKGTMKFENGTIQFTASPTPSEAYLQAKGAAETASTAETATAPEAAPAASAPAVDDASEYDQVPRTGDNSLALRLICLTGAAAVLFAGSYALYRKTN
ncbi:MAG: hypothetical protein NC517_07725 [Firmicutes bacterium]|nr:hypothetical protein [Bacillota bacterium]